jgi:signal transduction histidine kinase
MRLSIKAKQVLGVTSIVGLAIVMLSALFLTTMARVMLGESMARGELIAKAVFQRASAVVAGSREPASALRQDGGLRSILESSAFSQDVTYAAIVDVSGEAIVHNDLTLVGRKLLPCADLKALLDKGPIEQLRVIYSDQGQTLEIRLPLLLGSVQLGSIRIGVSMLLTRKELDDALGPAALTALAALVGATLVAMLLAQVLLRPIHMIRSGLTRLGQGEFGVRLDLPQHDEFGELGGSFNAVSAQLSADRTRLAGQKAKLESVVEHLEDAVAVFTPEGELLFANPAIRSALPLEPLGQRIGDLLPPGHPYRTQVEATLESGKSHGPISASVPAEGSEDADEADEKPAGERLILTHVMEDADHRLVGVMLIARDLDYLSQVQSTIAYSRKLAALGRLTAGVAHEIKNPLNATMIHLELVKQQLSGGGAARRGRLAQPRAPAPAASESEAAPDGAPVALAPGPDENGVAIDVPAAQEHLAVIAAQMRRLDEVVQGFLKFVRPEDMRLQPVPVASMLDDLMPIVATEALKNHVEVVVECPRDLPSIYGDPGMLHQAFLNLALNGCQAMPNGGRLRIAGAIAAAGRVEIVFEDTGVGIKPEHLDRIFDLYFTTKEHGSGIGLSMVYRTIQLHDGEIEVESTAGSGTIIRVLLPHVR